MSARLRFDKVAFSFGGRRIFDNLSFQLELGGCMALIGPNGAGKTTLLRLATGLLRCGRGKIFLGEHALATFTRKQAARRVALVPQDIEVPFDFSVQQIVAQGRTPHQALFGGSSRKDGEAVERAMDLADVSALRHRIFNELSGGERQRVKIALGLAQEPELLLLDEPTQNLDIGRQIELLDLIRFLRDQRITVLAATHDLQLIAGTFSSVLLLRPEQTAMCGPPHKILQPEILERAFNCPPRSYPVLVRGSEMRKEL